MARNRFVFLCSLRAAESRVEEPGWGPQPSGEDYARNLLSAGAVHAAHYSNNVNPGIFYIVSKLRSNMYNFFL